MIRIKIDGKMKAELPENINKDKFMIVLSLYLFNKEIEWKQIGIEKVKN